MRARLAIQSAGVTVELREIVLRDKAPEFLAASPKGTVPVVVANEQVIDESLDVMIWALNQHDPAGWLDMPPTGRDLITYADGPFKTALDHTKYANRHSPGDIENAAKVAANFLQHLDHQLGCNPFLFGQKSTLADYALLPFVRQFAHIDRAWFDAQDWPNTVGWLDRFLTSDRFAAIMAKYPKWLAGDPVTSFP